MELQLMTAFIQLEPSVPSVKDFIYACAKSNLPLFNRSSWRR